MINPYSPVLPPPRSNFRGSPSKGAGTIFRGGASMFGGAGAVAPNINIPAYNPQPAMQMYQDIFNRATTGSINSFDTAANRLRERLSSAAQGQREAASSANLSRGFGASGINDRAISRVNEAELGSYAQGLSDLANQFETQRLSGLGIANQSTQGVAGEQQFGYGSILQQAIENARNQTSAGIANANNRSQWDISRMGQNNQILEALIRALSSMGA